MHVPRPPININSTQLIVGKYGYVISANPADRYSVTSSNSVAVRWWSVQKPTPTVVPPRDRDHVFTSWTSSGHSGVMVTPPTIGASRVYPWFPFDKREYYTWLDGSYWALITPSAIPIIPDYSSRLARAEIGALNKLYTDSSAQLGLMAAEYGKSAELFSSGCRSFAKAIRQFRKGWSRTAWDAFVTGSRSRNVRHRGKGITDAWLKMVYGWKPQIDDINSSVTLLNDRYGPAGSLTHYATVEGFNKVKTKTEVERLSSVAVTGTQKFYTSLEAKHRIRVGLVYTLDSPFLAELNRMGLMNPEWVIWDLLPYSFVLDWAVPIGSWLEARRATLGYNFVSGYNSQSTKSVENGPTREIKSPPAGFSFDIDQHWSLQFKKWFFQRNLYANSPVPRVYFKNPTSSIHVANALSLLVSSVTKRS